MTTAEKTRATAVAASNIVRQTRDQYLVPSRTEVGVIHVVRRVNGRLSCTCDASFHGRSCWHVAAVTDKEARDRQAQRAATRPDPAIGIALLTGK